MQEVGLHLGSRACQLVVSAPASADLFARSAFNRLYYSAYLTTRHSLVPYFPNFPRDHSGVPQFLESLGKGRIAEIKRKARRANDHQLEQDCSAAKLAAKSLAELLNQSYAVRVLADYRPEVPVDFDASNNFSLNLVGFEKAKAWPQRASMWCGSILKAVMQS